jgi:hypothetical protein
MKTRTPKFLLVAPKLGIAIATLALASCAPRPIEDANPLDRPGDEKSAATLHEENMQSITSNPGYTLP